MAITGKAGVDAVIEMDFAANAKLVPAILHPRSTVVVYGTGSAEATIPAQFLLTNAIAHPIHLCLRADRRPSATPRSPRSSACWRTRR